MTASCTNASLMSAVPAEGDARVIRAADTCETPPYQASPQPSQRRLTSARGHGGPSAEFNVRSITFCFRRVSKVRSALREPESHATMRSACGTNWNFTASVSPRYSPSACSAIGRAERSVRDSEPSTDTRSRPRGGRLRTYSIWPTAFKTVVSRSRCSASRSSPELKSGLGTGSSGRLPR